MVRNQGRTRVVVFGELAQVVNLTVPAPIWRLRRNRGALVFGSSCGALLFHCARKCG
jgi:hypothetical protein